MKTPNDREEILENIRIVASEKECKAFVLDLYQKLTDPAFGSLPKAELELLLFKGLIDLNVIPANPDPYSLSAALRIKKSRATNLIYESDLRNRTVAQIQELCRESIASATLHEDKVTNKLHLQIENLRVQDEIKKVLLTEKIPTDRSISDSVLIIPVDGFSVLVNSFYPPHTEQDAEELLKSLKFTPKTTVETLLKGFLGAAAKKVAGEAGDRAATELGDFVVAQIKQLLSSKLK